MHYKNEIVATAVSAFMDLADLSHIYKVTSQLYLVIGCADVSFVQQQ